MLIKYLQLYREIFIMGVIYTCSVQGTVKWPEYDL